MKKVESRLNYKTAAEAREEAIIDLNYISKDGKRYTALIYTDGVNYDYTCPHHNIDQRIEQLKTSGMTVVCRIG